MALEYTNKGAKNKTRILVYPELSYRIAGLLYEVHNQLGRFCTERQYGDLFEQRLKENGFKYEREKELPMPGELNNKPASNKVDFYVENKILIDFKVKKFITKEDYFQMKRYLAASKAKLGFIVNFRNTYLKPKRVINL